MRRTPLHPVGDASTPAPPLWVPKGGRRPPPPPSRPPHKRLLLCHRRLPARSPRLQPPLHSLARRRASEKAAPAGGPSASAPPRGPQPTDTLLLSPAPPRARAGHTVGRGQGGRGQGRGATGRAPGGWWGVRPVRPPLRWLLTCRSNDILGLHGLRSPFGAKSPWSLIYLASRFATKPWACNIMGLHASQDRSR